MLQPVGVGHKTLADYTHLVGRDLIEEVRNLAEDLKGLKVLHLSQHVHPPKGEGSPDHITQNIRRQLRKISLDRGGEGASMLAETDEKLKP